MGKIQVVNIKEAFAKGFIDGHGKNKTPANFASYSINQRVENGATTVKKGYTTVVSNGLGTYIKGITGNSVTNKLLCISDGKLKEVNLTTKTLDIIGSVGSDGVVNVFNHGKYTIILVGTDKPYVYDGATLRQLSGTSYNPAFVTGGASATKELAGWTAVTNGGFVITIDGTARTLTGLNFSTVTSLEGVATIIQTAIRTLTSGQEKVEYLPSNAFRITSGNTTKTSAITVTSAGSGTDISGVAQYGTTGTYYLNMNGGTITASSLSDAPNINAIIGTAFAGFTVIAGNTATTNNYIYFSRPVIPANPERAFDWLGSGSENRNMQSKVLGLTNGLNNLYIFTQDTVEYVGRDSLASLNGTFSFYSSPIGKGDQLLNRGCAVTANDKAFYMTKNFTIKTLNYIQGTTDPAIGQLSDRALVSIRNFLDIQLAPADKQTEAFAITKEDKVYWYMKSINSPINDIAVVYDITNDNWYVDDSIYYSCMTVFNNNYYAGSYLNSNIIQDEVDYDMDGKGIPFEYWTVNMNLGSPLQRKLFKGRQISGEINFETKLTVETYVDGYAVASEDILGSELVESGINGVGSDPIGGREVGGGASDVDGGLVGFDKVSKSGNINIKGKQIQLRITSDNPSARFYIDYLAFMVMPIGSYQLQDVL